MATRTWSTYKRREIYFRKGFPFDSYSGTIEANRENTNTSKENEMTKLTVIGPNLRDQSKGTFHVHDANCADIHRRYSASETSDSYTADLATEREVIELIYEDIIAENEGDEVFGTWEGYRSEFHILPCVKFGATTRKEKEMNGKTIIVFSTKTNKVSSHFAKKPSQELLEAACKPANSFAEQIDKLTVPQLTAIYNANSGKDVKTIKKFANKPIAIERTAEILADVPEFDGEAVPVPDGNGDNSALSAGVAKSWADPDVRKRRSQRHGVKVAGKEFPSLQAAYREFDIDMKDHREFRMLLKADCSKKIKRHGKTWQAFER